MTCSTHSEGSENAKWCSICLQGKVTDLERRLAESEASRAAMRRFSRHTFMCNSYRQKPCNCGLDDTLRDAGRSLLEVVEAARVLMPMLTHQPLDARIMSKAVDTLREKLEALRCSTE